MTEDERNFGNLPSEPEELILAELVNESRKILSNPQEVYDLAGKRLAVRCIELEQHFSTHKNTVRVAVLGNPILGKTTYSYSAAKILQAYSFPASYIDLDLYTKSGLAMAGITNSWDTTRNDIPEDEIEASIQTFKNSSPGIILGDCPGRLSNPNQVDRLKASSIALIFAQTLEDRDKWAELCTKAGVDYRWALSRKSTTFYSPIYPQVVGLERKVQFTTPLLVSATSLIEAAAELTNAPQSKYHDFFSQGELVVLEEILDFYYSIQMP